MGICSTNKQSGHIKVLGPKRSYLFHQGYHNNTRNENTRNTAFILENNPTKGVKNKFKLTGRVCWF